MVNSIEELNGCHWTGVGIDNRLDYAVKEETRKEGTEPLSLGIRPRGRNKISKWNAESLRDFKGPLSEMSPYEAIVKSKLLI